MKYQAILIVLGFQWEIVDKVITKVASGLHVREGVDAFQGDAIVNSTHPLLCGAADVVGLVKKAKASFDGLKRVTTARLQAGGHMAEAIKGGR